MPTLIIIVKFVVTKIMARCNVDPETQKLVHEKIDRATGEHEYNLLARKNESKSTGIEMNNLSFPDDSTISDDSSPPKQQQQKVQVHAQEGIDEIRVVK